MAYDSEKESELLAKYLRSVVKMKVTLYEKTGVWPDEDDPEWSQRHLLYALVRDFATGEIETLPNQAAYVLTAALRDAVAGFTHPIFNPKRARGQRDLDPSTEIAVGFAVEYLHLCRLGLIADDKPNKTIRELYKVHDSTVRSWARNPKFKKYIHLPDEKYTDTEIRVTKGAVQHFGDIYQQSLTSSSQNAIRQRARKK